MNLIKKVFTRNDIYRAVGLALIVWGQYSAKTPFTGFGVSIDTNVLQIAGIIFIMIPFITRYIASKKETQSGGTQNIQ